MQSDLDKPFKKNSGAKTTPPGSTGSSLKFGKWLGRDASQPWPSTTEPTANLSSNERAPSRLNTNYAESSISSGGEDNPSYLSRSAVRLVNARRGPSESEMAILNASGLSLVTDSPAIDSVLEETERTVGSPDVMPSRPSTPSGLPYDRVHTTPPPSRATTPLPSMSRVHWNQLRNAIIPGSPLSTSRPLVPDANVPMSGTTAAPPRSQTPKPSRFARLGFRQVVESTRELIHDETSQLEADIHYACAIARFGEVRHKAERDGSQPGYLPFMSTASLPLSTATVASQQSRSSQPSELSGRAPPSIKPLHQTLVRYATSPSQSGSMARLPYESEVLSVLLVPFMAESGRQAEERWLAVETFEIAVQTWRASSLQREVDRVLWCCKAGLIPASPVRSRVLGTLSNLLFSSAPVQDVDPLALQNMMQGLQLLLHQFSGYQQHSLVDTQVVRELCTHISSGASGHMETEKIENEYGAEWGSQDTEETIRAQIVAEGMVRCMQNGSEGLRRWALHEAVETYWPLLPTPLSPLCSKIVTRRLNTFIRCSLSLLRLETAQTNRHLLESDATTVVRLLQHRALAELEQLPPPKHANDGRALAVELLLELLSIDAQRLGQQVVGLICSWCGDANGWKESMETGIRLLVERAEWPHLVEIIQNIVNKMPDEKRKQLVAVVLPALHTRLVTDPAPYPLTGLTSLLRSLVELYPQQFYKPLFSLAGATRDPTVVGHLGIVTVLARHLPDFWTRDSEMVSVALMSDIGGAIGKGKAKEGQPLPWARTRIGQSLIMVELIRSVKEMIKQKRDLTSPPDGSQAEAYRFITGLEARLAILLEAKEKSALVPFSQRVLLSILFLEIRLFTRSLKPAPWLQKIITWTTQAYPGATLQTADNPFPDQRDLPQRVVADEVNGEIMSAMGKIQSIYVACWQSPPSNSRQRSTMILSPSFDPRSQISAIDHHEASAEAIKEREELLTSLSTGVAPAAMRVLVAVCALLTQADHRTLGPVLWSKFLDDEDPGIVAPACFLLMHCLEKSPKDATQLIEDDRCSPDTVTRGALIRRLMTLFAWRSQLLSQTYVYDRARRRPFKLARQPIAFVAIDVGSGSYVHEQTEEDRKNLPGGTLPFELRKRLAEVGWEQDDQPTDIRLEKVRAPMSLFPAAQLDHFSTVREQAVSSSSRSPENAKQLLRRKSSASGHHPGAKRRPVFVPALVSLFSSMALLTIDSHPAVASAAREAILLMLRDDPVMLCRPVMETLSTDLKQVAGAISVLRTFLRVHNRLPPSASHHIFSHLGGFLKHISRDSEDPNALRAFSYTVPILAKLISQVSNLTIRDLRRSKFEIYVFPSGSLWFPPTAPSSTMFPQSLGRIVNPFDELPPQLVAICMIRTAQNMLFLDMLKHKPQEVHVVRKSLSSLVLPGENTGKELDARSFLPRQSSDRKPRRTAYQQVSLALSRSHLLLLQQVFRSMPRNFNGSSELARLFDGINRIMLAHGDDIGIVTHALIACMIGITRFKRLVSSSRGFALFMPCLLKAYAEAEGHVGIRHAIQYASTRFFAIHEEAYLFQSFDLASNILVRLDHPNDRRWFSGNIWLLFSALRVPLHRGISDAAGIHDCNRAEEREALIATTVIDQTPQAATQESPRGEQLKKIIAMGQYENKLLQLEDLVKLCLTVIAHDPTILRSQNFLTLFRHMTPDFYNGSKSAREVLRDGIDALGSALFAKTLRQKVQEGNQGRLLPGGSVETLPHHAGNGLSLFDDPLSPCDHVVMRREYLGLIVAFNRMGGDVPPGTIRRALDLVKGLLKEPIRPEPDSEGVFLHELTESSLLRLGATAKHALALLHDVAPVIRTFALSMNCSGVLESVTELLKRQELASNATFVTFVVEQIAGPVLEACGDAAVENLLMSLPIRPSVISLLSHAAALGNADVAGTIEKQTPSPGFLAGIVLPLCLMLKTSAEIATENQWQTKERTGKSGLVFVRLLAYVMDACGVSADRENGRSSPLPSLSRRDSERSKRSSVSISRTPLAKLMVVVQIIKIIIFRASDDLSSGLPGIWARLARFLRQLLDEGDANFALPSGPSPSPSPWQSPKLGPNPGGFHTHTRSLSPDSQLPSSPSSHPGEPRVVDYLAWSLLEFFCCAPSPLTLQMRLWMQERVHKLDAELKTREIRASYSGRGSRRLSSSVFAKVRYSAASPEALRASHGFSRTPSELNLSASTSTDFSAYNRFPPPSPGSLQPAWTGPRIVHLGPAKDNRMFQPMERSSSQDSHLKNLAQKEHIRSQSLARMTCDRIRIVQTCMGYDRLLPIEGRGNEASDVTLKVWTKVSTLTMLVKEAKLIMDEFPADFHESVGDDFVDVPSNSGHAESRASSPVKKPILF